jgi:LPS O-antigen subunit length determinant protein (WzzB/FepE family)
MPRTVDLPLSPIIQDLILDRRIQTLEEALIYAQRTDSADPSLPEGWAILDAMKCERGRRHDAYEAMLDADPNDVDALIAGDSTCRALFRLWFDELEVAADA